MTQFMTCQPSEETRSAVESRSNVGRKGNKNSIPDPAWSNNMSTTFGFGLSVPSLRISLPWRSNRRWRDEDYSGAGITIIDINREVRWRGGKE
jgi:hypothetical protein